MWRPCTVRGPGSGFDARHSSTAAPSTSQPPPMEYDRPKRKLIRLDDDDEDGGAAASRPPPSTATDDDTLEAFMASLQDDKSDNKQNQRSAAKDDDSERKDGRAEAGKEEEEELDPIDAYMAELEASTNKKRSRAQCQRKVDLSLDDDDPMSSYLHAQAEAAAKKRAETERRAAAQGQTVEQYLELKRKRGEDVDDELEYNDAVGGDDGDDDEESLARRGGARAQHGKGPLLPTINHAAINYPPIHKQLYTEHSELANMPHNEIQQLTQDFGISISGAGVPRLCFQWKYFSFLSQLQSAINRQDFDAPTPIQAQAIPAALSGRDLIALAKTGSGKTCAFIWPMVIHITSQPPLPNEEGVPLGPRGLILAPTRELADQLYQEAYRYARVMGLSVAPLMGGMQMYEQKKILKSGVDIAVATCGRLVDLVAAGDCDLRYVSMAVLDEADRMLGLGFEAALNALLASIRPDRQLLLFSATFAPNIERMARRHLNDPIRIQIDADRADDLTQTLIQQQVVMLPSFDAKVEWLIRHMEELLRRPGGAVLIFCSTRNESEDVARRLAAARLTALAPGGGSGSGATGRGSSSSSIATLHGDHHQAQRLDVMSRFKSGSLRVLVATDVAARGLDVKHLSTVVQFDCPRSRESHTHRVGRTGRAGKEGLAITLVCKENDTKYAGVLVECLEEAGHHSQVSDELLNLAMMHKAWAAGRARRGAGGGERGGRGGGRGGRGGGAGRGLMAPQYNAVAPPSQMAAAASRVPQPQSHAVTTAPLASAPTAVPSSTSSIHPSRLGMIAGTTVPPVRPTQQYAAIPPPPPSSLTYQSKPAPLPLSLPPPPTPSSTSLPIPPPPVSYSAATASTPASSHCAAQSPTSFVHPSRLGLVPQSQSQSHSHSHSQPHAQQQPTAYAYSYPAATPSATTLSHSTTSVQVTNQQQHQQSPSQEPPRKKSRWGR